MRFTLTVVLSLLAISVFGQLNKLTGDVTDDQGKGLPAATVVLLSPSDSTMMYFGISSSEGHWEIKNIKSGSYLMQFAFLGFETEWRNISLPYDKGEYWGIMAMKPKALKENISYLVGVLSGPENEDGEVVNG